MSRYQVVWYCSRFLQTLVVIFPAKVYAGENPCKMAIFWLVFRAKNPVKSDKLALIEGEILNLIRDKKLSKSIQSYYSVIF